MSIVRGSLEKNLPFYHRITGFIYSKATNHRIFLGLFAVYFIALGLLATLPSVDFTTESAAKSEDAKSNTKEAAVGKSLVEVLAFAGPLLTALHLSLLTVLGFCAAVIASLTLVLIMYRLCAAEDSYFDKADGIWPFRAVSIAPIPIIWWTYFELSEKSLMLFSIFANGNNYQAMSFHDYSLYAPLSQKWESLHFIAIFSFITLLTGLVKLYVFRFTTGSRPSMEVATDTSTTSSTAAEPQKPLKKPPGLSRVQDITEEAWMKSDPKPEPVKSKKSNKSTRKRK